MECPYIYLNDPMNIHITDIKEHLISYKDKSRELKNQK
jgi:hypothetical protein